MITTEDATDTGIVARAKRASLSVLRANPQLGIWQATGTVIGHSPNLTELRDIELGGDNIVFNAHGHSIRLAALEEDTGQLALVKTRSSWSNPKGVVQEKTPLAVTQHQHSATVISESPEEIALPTSDSERNDVGHQKHKHQQHHHLHHRALFKRHHEHVPAKWESTIMYGLKALWKFFITPSGFLMTIYVLNVVVSHLSSIVKPEI